MKIEIYKIDGRGNASREVVWLTVLEDANLQYYILADTTYTSNNAISNKLRHMLWLPTKSVHKGDWVAVHTGTGNNRSETAKDGSTIHHIYWGLGNAVWNDKGDTGILFELNTWKAKKE